MSDILKTTIDVNKQSANMSYPTDYDTNAGKFDNKSTWENIWKTSTDTLQKSLGIFTGGGNQEVQAISQGVAEGTVQSIGAVKDITKYLAIAGIIVVGLIIYSKLK